MRLVYLCDIELREIPLPHFTGTVRGKVTRFGKVTIGVIISHFDFDEEIEITFNMIGNVSGEEMSGTADALNKG
jgi:hypothetical protein